MKKFTLAVIIIGAFILFSLLYNHNNTLALPQNTLNNSGSSSTNTTTSTPGASDPPTNTPGTSTTHYKDGTYTGSVADAQWGNVQVQVIIQNGKMTHVTFLQYPNERERSIMINSQADPELISEAISAQSATVDVVTGATDSSEAFMQSLASALSQAQN